MSKSGRPISGYARPGSNRQGTANSRGALSTAMKANRLGTAAARPMTNAGRMLRLGTASLMGQGDGDNFIASDKINAQRTAQKKHMAKAVVDYLIYFEGNFRVALDISAEASVAAKYEDWWWKARLGKCYLKMGLIHEAEKQLLSSLKN